jgi:SAM-dependent methyltransferase
MNSGIFDLRRRVLLAQALMAGLGWCAGGEEAIWKAYVAWYRAQPIGVSDPLPAYLEYLRVRGAGAGEIEQRRSVLERLTRERRAELHPFFFDRTYTSPEPRFNTQPNRLLAETVRGLAPGRALDIHMGQGRNALFLAARGWDVTGFDFSAEGVRVAREAAARAGVRLTALVARHEDFDFGVARWDLLLMSYTWVPLREPYVTRIVNSLAPGGVIVFEHMMEQSAGEHAAPWLPRPGQLKEIFGRLEILRYEDTRSDADWSWRPERIARMVVRKPAAPR